MKKFPLPEVSWERGVLQDGTTWIKVKTSKYPSLINGWTADTRNGTRRDFRWAKVKNEAVDWPTNSEEQKTNTVHAWSASSSSEKGTEQSYFERFFESPSRRVDGDDIELQLIK